MNLRVAYSHSVSRSLVVILVAVVVFSSSVQSDTGFLPFATIEINLRIIVTLLQDRERCEVLVEDRRRHHQHHPPHHHGYVRSGLESANIIKRFSNEPFTDKIFV